jgi:hypothetical protein
MTDVETVDVTTGNYWQDFYRILSTAIDLGTIHQNQPLIDAATKGDIKLIYELCGQMHETSALDASDTRQSATVDGPQAWVDNASEYFERLRKAEAFLDLMDLINQVTRLESGAEFEVEPLEWVHIRVSIKENNSYRYGQQP